MTIERGDAPDTLLNGRAIDGRSYMNRDGSFDSIDLTKMIPGDEVTIKIGRDVTHRLVKGGEIDHAGALENWSMSSEGAAAFGSNVLVLLESNRAGASFRTPGAVLRRGLELGTIDVLAGDDTRHVIKNLGIIAGIGYRSLVERIAEREEVPAS